MVPLDYALQNGQQVEIIAAKQGGPSRDWLNPDLGYVHSHRARAKVRQWFKAQQHDETVAQGRAMVERELARARADARSSSTPSRRRRASRRRDDFFAAFARDEINSRQVQAAIHAVAQPAAADAAPPSRKSSRARSRATQARAAAFSSSASTGC